VLDERIDWLSQIKRLVLDQLARLPGQPGEEALNLVESLSSSLSDIALGARINE
jgi:hypothetical protein